MAWAKKFLFEKSCGTAEVLFCGMTCWYSAKGIWELATIAFIFSIVASFIDYEEEPKP